MDIRIFLEFGQGYTASLTVQDARTLYDALGAMFNTHFLAPLGNNGYEAPVKVEDKASPTEATGTLRDEAQHQCKGLHCWCMVPRYEARPNGICNDPTIPVENW